MEGNLPSWRGDSAVYSKAYAVLARMGRTGHVTPHVYHRNVGRNLKGKCISGMTMAPSEDMNDLIEALNKGNEERIKGLLLLYADRGIGKE